MTDSAAGSPAPVSSPSVLSAARPAADAQRTERRDLILHAAERCFVSFGFHRTTMQLVAREAGMSPGNLYRYFPSKNAIVEGLVERDRDEARRRFARIDPDLPFWDQFARLGEEYFLGDAHSKAALCVEIWAEAARNPEIDAINRPIEQEIADALAALLENARARGEIAADVDCVAAAQIIMVITSGLYVRSALRRGGDGADQFGHAEFAHAEFAHAMQAVCGLLCGRPVLRLGEPGAGGDAVSGSFDSSREPSS